MRSRAAGSFRYALIGETVARAGSAVGQDGLNAVAYEWLLNVPSFAEAQEIRREMDRESVELGRAWRLALRAAWRPRAAGTPGT